ncbi:MAG: NUDIX hydrolase [Candidatus Hodarchaeales archaeon]|jgi:8-oxo-dGTP diphosphatase
MVQTTVIGTLCFIMKKNHEGTEVLLLERNKKPDDFHDGRYVGLGGKLEANEAPRDGIIREVQEEAGIVIDPEFRGILYEIFKNTKNSKETRWLVFIYTADFPPDGQLKDCEEGTFHWVDTTKINDIYMWEGDYKFLDILFNTSEIIELYTQYDDDQLVRWER